MTEAARPASNAVQSKNMWNESEIRPRLLVHTPYKSSTNAKDKLRMRNRKRFRDALSEKINLNHPCSLSVKRRPRRALNSLSSACRGNIGSIR